MTLVLETALILMPVKLNAQKNISVSNIARMNREFLAAKIS